MTTEGVGNFQQGTHRKLPMLDVVCGTLDDCSLAKT